MAWQGLRSRFPEGVISDGSFGYMNKSPERVPRVLAQRPADDRRAKPAPVYRIAGTTVRAVC
ncbi:hypothetical protein CBM2634_B120037 [Cupriavidus taiwanensis]|uniref:Uncharacterized protein n=1 Tax=Cupriavidus taiwanensis TaxID=164546 RepID=A0A375J407_9BURK|nr:hypothetical protein CBM2634_B120037 [Cupriavidus taiwanensis]